MHPAREACQDGMTGIGQRRKESALGDAEDSDTNGHYSMKKAIEFTCRVVLLSGSPVRKPQHRGVQELQAKRRPRALFFGLESRCFHTSGPIQSHKMTYNTSITPCKYGMHPLDPRSS